MRRCLFLLVPGLLATVPAFSQTPAVESIEIREGLGLPGAGRGGRTPLPIDLIAQQIARGEWKMPVAGSRVNRPGGGEPLVWSSLRAGDDGIFQGRELIGGYLYATVDSPAQALWILEASGHAMVYVNGEPRGGDPYSNGSVRLPVLLKAGMNELLFRTGRGRLKARLVEPKTEAVLNPADTTLPDLVLGETVAAWCALPVLNVSASKRVGLVLETKLGDSQAVRTPVSVLMPLGARKVGFRIEARAPSEIGTASVKVRLLDRDDANARVLDELSLELRVRSPDQSRKRTFLSSIDGSVQYYAHLPWKTAPAGNAEQDKPALFLSLHGASVEAIGQADAYGSKDWGHLVAPTNRRPYGFDWEDWGRFDAMEVLELVSKDLGTDPDRTYLTGHSMGGHGTWHIGVTFPGRFAAIAPSAGWISMWSYAGARLRPEGAESTPEALLSRAASPSDTLGLKENYGMLGVYVLHGDLDDNVPIGQARTMREELGRFHPDFAYYERPGAGHWWGNECVDWPPLFGFLQRHKRPGATELKRVVFATMNPGVSAEAGWVRIESQVKAMVKSRVELKHDPKGRVFSGTTENVARLSLDLGHLEPGKAVKVTLDGHEVLQAEWPENETRVWLNQSKEGTWAVTGAPELAEKGPHRAGPYKEAFRNKMVFVYGTRGTEEETAWGLSRARFDAEVFGYQGNGSVDVVADTDFDPTAEPDRGVIVYGNADTHEDWETLLGKSPVQVRRRAVKIGEREVKGEGLACLFIQPRPGSTRASVAAVSGTDLTGFRVTDRLPVFVSGVAYPDFFLANSSVLGKGSAGLVGCGYFGPDWSVEKGEFAWAESAVADGPR